MGAETGEPFDPAPSQAAAVLVVDDDPGILDTFQRVLTRLCGYEARGAASARAALSLLDANRFDLLVVDLRLPDMSGIELVQNVPASCSNLPFVLVSGFADVATTVQAMRLGAFTVLEKPVSVDDLTDAARSAISDCRRWSATSSGGAPATGRSVSVRLANQIARVCDSDGDLKTITEWAHFVGMSYTTLSEVCRLARVIPHDARDFARVLRAVSRARTEGCPPEALLDVSDRRTLQVLMDKAGLLPGSEYHGTVADYICTQQFIPADNPVLKILQRLLSL